MAGEGIMDELAGLAPNLFRRDTMEERIPDSSAFSTIQNQNT